MDYKKMTRKKELVKYIKETYNKNYDSSFSRNELISIIEDLEKGQIKNNNISTEDEIRQDNENLLSINKTSTDAEAPNEQTTNLGSEFNNKYAKLDFRDFIKMEYNITDEEVNQVIDFIENIKNKTINDNVPIHTYKKQNLHNILSSKSGTEEVRTHKNVIIQKNFLK